MEMIPSSTAPSPLSLFSVCGAEEGQDEPVRRWQLHCKYLSSTLVFESIHDFLIVIGECTQ